MAARVVTLAFSGVEAVRVDVQVQFTRGDSKFFLVGMGDKAVSESRERVRAAFVGMGLSLPAKRIIANLAPADLPKARVTTRAAMPQPLVFGRKLSTRAARTAAQIKNK